MPARPRSDLLPAFAAVVTAMGSGELAPDEAAVIAGVLEAKRKAIETGNLEKIESHKRNCLCRPPPSRQVSCEPILRVPRTSTGCWAVGRTNDKALRPMQPGC